MNGVAGWSYEQMATGRMTMLRTMMDAVINAELTIMVPVLKALVIIWITRQFLFFMYGLVSFERLMISTIRPLVIALLIVQAGSFVHRVRDPIMDTIPRAVASTIMSAAGVQTTSTADMATQFDTTAAGVDMLSDAALKLNTGWSASALANAIGIFMATTGAQLILSCIFGFFLLGQTMMAIVLCFGPLVLVFEIFERTRQWVASWLTKIVGLVAFGIGTSLLLAIQLTELRTLLSGIDANASGNAATAAGAMIRVASNLVLDLLTMAALPAIAGFGSAAAASMASPSIAAMRGASAGAGAAGVGAARAAGAGLRSSAGAVRSRL